MSNLTISEMVTISGGGIAPAAHVLYMIAIAIIVVFTVVGNVGTIVAFWKVPALSDKASDLLILCLTYSDLGIGIVGMFDYVALPLGYWPYGKIGCQARAMFRDMCVTVGIVTTGIISFDRLLLVSQEYPKYLKTQSKSRIVGKIVGAWVYGAAVGLSEVILWPYVKVPAGVEEFDYDVECRNPVKHNVLCSLVYYILVIFLPLLLVEIFSMLFIHRLRRRLRGRVASRPSVFATSEEEESPPDRAVRCHNNPGEGVLVSVENATGNGQIPVTPPQAPPASGRRYMKAAVVLGALVTVLNICFLPFVLYSLTIGIFCPKCNSTTVRDFLSTLIYLNSCLNPVLYAITMRKIRLFYRGMLCGR